MTVPVFTIGYGNRAIGDFIDLLRHYQVACLVDTRSIPYSRFRPDFRKNALQQHLEGSGIQYLYLGEALGGKRIAPECYVNGVLDLERLAAREDFSQSIALVEVGARADRCLALMCAELRPEQCHRAWMLAPILEARGIQVLHIDQDGVLKTQQEVCGWFPST